MRTTKAQRVAAITTVIDNIDLIAAGGNPQEFAEKVAMAVVTAEDSKVRWVVVTSDRVVFGPYAAAASAHKAIDKGLCASRSGTKAMVLPMTAAPRAGRHTENDPVVSGQMTLFEMEGS
jgi:hypothetical protein